MDAPVSCLESRRPTVYLFPLVSRPSHVVKPFPTRIRLEDLFHNGHCHAALPPCALHPPPSPPPAPRARRARVLLGPGPRGEPGGAGRGPVRPMQGAHPRGEERDAFIERALILCSSFHPCWVYAPSYNCAPSSHGPHLLLTCLNPPRCTGRSTASGSSRTARRPS